MKEVQLFERALDSIHTVSNISVVAPSLQGQLVFVHGPLSVDEVRNADLVIVGVVTFPVAKVRHSELTCMYCMYVHAYIL